MDDIRVKWYDPKIGLPEISIGSYGLSFNKAATTTLGEPEAIRIGVLDDNARMVVAPIDKQVTGSIKYIARERNGTVRINSKSIVRFLELSTGINFKRTAKFAGQWDETNQWLIFDLRKPIWISGNDEIKQDNGD